MYTCFCCAVDQSQEASGIRCNRGHLDRPANVRDKYGLSGHRHRQGNVCTLGCLQQLRRGEDDHFINLSDRTALAVNSDGILLLKNRLRTKTQGNTRITLSLEQTSCPSVSVNVLKCLALKYLLL